VTPSQLEILQHSLGCDAFGKSKTPLRDEGDGCFGYYRNRYVSEPTPELIELVKFGLMADSGPMKIAGGMNVYHVTRHGLETMSLLSPKPPKLTRSQERYRRYREVADCFNSFLDFLKYEQQEKKRLASL